MPQYGDLAAGQIIKKGTPTELVQAIKGQVWKKVIERDQLDAYKDNHNVISSHLTMGQTVIFVNADANPGDGFEASEPTLEDVYFSAIAESRNGHGAADAAA